MTVHKLVERAKLLVKNGKFDQPENYTPGFSWDELKHELRTNPLAMREPLGCRGSMWENVWYECFELDGCYVRIVAADGYLVVFRTSLETSEVVGEPLWPKTMDEVRKALDPVVIHELELRYGKRQLVTV